MVDLRKSVLACALVWCWTTTASFLPAQPREAARPDEGAPPRPNVSTSASNASPEEQLGRIAVLFAERCVACHGADKQEGNYSVVSFEALRVSGDSGQQPIIAGQPKASELYRRLVTPDEAERMPAESEPLESQALELVQAWIAAGAQVPPDLERRPLAQWPRTQPPRRIPEHYPAALPIAALALAPNCQSVWTSGYGEVIQWDLSSGQLLHRQRTAGTQVADIEISRDGRYLAVSSGTPGTQGVVEVWRLEGPLPGAAVWSDKSSDIAPDIGFAPTRPRLAVGRVDGSLLLVNLESSDSGLEAGTSQAAASVFTPHADAILCVAWSDSGERLITGSRDRTAKIFDADTMDLIANYDRHQRAVGGVAYAGAHPVSFDETGQLRLWTGDDSDRTVAEQSNLPRFLEHLVSSGDRIYLADGADVRIVRVEKKQSDDGKDGSGKAKSKTTTRWREEDRLKSDDHRWIMAIDQAGDMLAAGTESGEVVVWYKNEPTPKFQLTAKP